MMGYTQEDTGLITVLLERFEKQRLPRALALKEKVERGESLNDMDLMFLKDVMEGVSDIKPLLNRHPECKQLITKMVNLCNEIATKGVSNEKVV